MKRKPRRQNLLNKFQKMLMKIALGFYKTNKDPALSLEDFFQDLVLIMYENYDYKLWKSDGGASFGTYLHSCSVNHLINIQKRKDFHKRTNNAVEFDEISFSVEDERIIFEKLYNKPEMIRLLIDLQKGGFSRLLSLKSSLFMELKSCLE